MNPDRLDFSQFTAKSTGKTSPCVRCRAELPWPCTVCEDCQRKIEHNAWLERILAGVPKRFRFLTFQRLAEVGWASKMAIAATQSAQDAPIVVLAGSAGSGKTSLAAALFRARIEVVRRGAWMSALELSRCRAITQLGHGEPEMLSLALRTPLLVLDELPVADPSGAVRDVLHARYDAELPTIVTTWMEKDIVAAAYGDGVARRMWSHDIGSVVVDCSA